MIVGIDMGGTNIDGVIISNGKIIDRIKKPTDRDNLFESIWTALNELLKPHDKTKIQRINLSTTISTNAIVENKTTPVGMIIQPGPGMPYEFLACGEKNAFISGYIDHRGEVIEKYALSEINNAIALFNENNIHSAAVVTKFSTRNPKFEKDITKTLLHANNNGKKNFTQITMGHTMSGKLNFPRRVYTSYLNSAVHSKFNDFANSIKDSLVQEGMDVPVFMLKADGGTMDISAAENKPVETILSGPAASLMGINAMLPTNEDAILLDIGGTTTDIFFLADGIPLFEPLGIKIAKHNTLIRAIYSMSMALGGDSSIIAENGSVKIGPNRNGVPYAFGGPSPTPTDAMIALGIYDGCMNKGNTNMNIKSLAREAMSILGEQLKLPMAKTAELIIKTMGSTIRHKVYELLNEINNRPVYTVKELLYGKVIQPKLINIIGGPANVLAPVLQKEFNLPCHYPTDYHVANAIGAALAIPTIEINMLVNTSQGMLSVPELEIYEKVSRNYSIENARQKAMDLVKKSISLSGAYSNAEAEITEESSFNMVNGFYTAGKNMRIKAQVKPGLAFKLGGE